MKIQNENICESERGKVQIGFTIKMIEINFCIVHSDNGIHFKNKKIETDFWSRGVKGEVWLDGAKQRLVEMSLPNWKKKGKSTSDVLK